jgi:hypothetical protein
MGDVISVDRQRLLSTLADLVGYPNPDDPGDPDNPFGPYGPSGAFIRVCLNATANGIARTTTTLGEIPQYCRFFVQRLKAIGFRTLSLT